MLRSLFCKRFYSSSSSSLLSIYNEKIKLGQIIYDSEQEKVLLSLEKTSNEINNYFNDMNIYWDNIYKWEQNRSNILNKILKKQSNKWFNFNNEDNIKQKLLDDYNSIKNINLSNIQSLKQAFIQKLSSGTKSWPDIHKELIENAQRNIINYDITFEKQHNIPSLPIRPISPKGIYLYGQVGTGKTMTMNLLLENLWLSLEHKQIEIINYSSSFTQLKENHILPPVASEITQLPVFSPFTNPCSDIPPLRIIYAHFSDFIQSCYRSMHYFNSLSTKDSTIEYFDAIDSCISNFIGYRLHRDPPNRLSNILLNNRLDSSVEYIMNRLKLPPLILFFDEFQMIDIGDSAIIKSIFERLIRYGSIIITSCNLPPKHLLQFSTQSNDIKEFTNLLNDSLNVISLPSYENRDKIIDYRTKHYQDEKNNNINTTNNTFNILNNIFFIDKDKHKFNKLFNTLIDNNNIIYNYKLDIINYNRQTNIPIACIEKKICQYTFEELCSNELSSNDYNTIVKYFSIIFIKDIPQLSIKYKNEVRRFINLIDQVYNQTSLIILHSKENIDSLFKELPSDIFDTNEILENLQFERSDNYGKLIDKKSLSQFSGKAEKFAFSRALSRLKEMQTSRYLLSSNIINKLIN